MSSSNTQQPSTIGTGGNFLAQLRGTVTSAWLADVSAIIGLVIALLTSPNWLKGVVVSFLLFSWIIYNRNRISGWLAAIPGLPNWLRHWLWAFPLVLTIPIVGTGIWLVWDTYFRNSVPITRYEYTLHRWGSSDYTEVADQTGRYYRWSYDREDVGKYTGFEYDFGVNRLRNLNVFEAVQVRIGFEGEADGCWFYIKESPERSTGERFQLNRRLRYAPGAKVSDQYTEGSLLIETVTFPLREHFPTTNLQQVLAVGFQAGESDYPLKGVCRIYDLTFLRSMP